MKTKFTKESFFSVSREELFAFHERPDAFSLLTPENLDVEVLSTASTLEPSDDIVRFVVRFLFLKFGFEMVHTAYQRPDLFVDEQRKGLFSFWRHRHRFLSGGWQGDPASMLQDEIEFGHPLLFAFVPFVRHRLKSLFRYRHEKTRQQVMNGQERRSEGSRSRVVITGATGLIGRRIVQILEEKGVQVAVLVRDVKKAAAMLGDTVTPVYWDFDRPEAGEWRAALQGAQGVIHLAGTPLFDRRWTASFKRQMEQSRVQSTRQLVEAIRSVASKPEVFVSASAVGIYGTDPDRQCDENTGAADDLLARICLNWESEARKVEADGVRTVQIRIGIALSRQSGALKELLPLFRAGLGGTMGSARHSMNWIHVEDLARIFVMALFNADMKGPYNAVAPHPVTNQAFGQTLASALKRPALFRYPVPLLKAAIGEAADYASGGPTVSSDKIQGAGYRFFFEDLEPALQNVLRE